MSLVEISVEHLRCLERVTLKLDSAHNLIWGSNASGKTSLLESIFLLGRGRSFRTRNSEKLIRQGEDRLTVFGRLDEPGSRSIGVQVSRREGTSAKVSGAFVQSLAELSQVFPVQIIEPGIHRLIEEGGYLRRRWMDWATFHVEPGFIENWSSYTRGLKQRNAALRTHPDLVNAWDPELARLGELISESRRAFIERLQPYWIRIAKTLVDIPLELSYARGWLQAHSLAEALSAARERDVARGVTHVGPHRADLTIRAHGKTARDVLSRGQQKLTAIAMTLAQLHLIREVTGIRPTLLLDDPAAELDQGRLDAFTTEVLALKCQLVVTALTAAGSSLGCPSCVFHVERGGLLPV